MATTARVSRALLMVEKLLGDGTVTEADLVREMVVTESMLAAYRYGGLPMPLERQLCLALFMARLPGKYARLGVRLRDQVRAAMAFHGGMTSTHMEAPPPGSRWPADRTPQSQLG